MRSTARDSSGSRSRPSDTGGDALYPEACLGCHRPTRGGLCLDCLESFPSLSSPGCNRCGAAASANSQSSVAASCSECARIDFSFDAARQCFRFQELVRTAIHRLKYRGERGLAAVLAIPMAEIATAFLPAAATWVPVSSARHRSRGVDHAKLLCEEVSRLLEIPRVELFVRARDTQPQVGMSPDRRLANVRGAFGCRLPAPERVLVVDDVFTTGATASEIATTAKNNGASFVGVVTVARAITA